MKFIFTCWKQFNPEENRFITFQSFLLFHHTYHVCQSALASNLHGMSFPYMLQSIKGGIQLDFHFDVLDHHGASHQMGGGRVFPVGNVLKMRLELEVKIHTTVGFKTTSLSTPPKRVLSTSCNVRTVTQPLQIDELRHSTAHLASSL